LNLGINMNAFKNILNKLYSEDNGVFAILKAENKIELAAIDDLRSAQDSAEVIFVDASLNDAVEKADEIYELHDEWSRVSEDFYLEFENLESKFSQLKDKMDNLEEKLNAYEELSDELGIDPNNSDVYRFSDILLVEMQEEYREYDNNYNRLSGAFNLAKPS
tara:strand:- start:2494 stop:2979 length:486 start_codon:yes stop_codon:yes gene_type:complete